MSKGFKSGFQQGGWGNGGYGSYGGSYGGNQVSVARARSGLLNNVPLPQAYGNNSYGNDYYGGNDYNSYGGGYAGNQGYDSGSLIEFHLTDIVTDCVSLVFATR